MFADHVGLFEHRIDDLPNDAISALFQAAIEATEEAILNSLFTATTVFGHNETVGRAIPLTRLVALLPGGDQPKAE